MTTPPITSSSLTRTTGSESGVVLTVSTGGVQCHHVKTHRATGRKLEVLGVLGALLAPAAQAGTVRLPEGGRRWLESGTVLTVLADEDTTRAVRAACESGEVLVPEAVHALQAVTTLVEKYTRTGVEVRFEVGTQEASPEQLVDLDTVSERLQEEAARSQVRTEAWELPAPEAAWVQEHGASVVYTDGSFSPTTGFGSWAWYVDESTHGSGTVAGASSGYMERRAALEALEALEGPVLLVTDLEGLLPAPSSRVLPPRERRALRKLRQRTQEREVRILTVKGHAHCPGNLAVDELAGEALQDAWSRICNDPALRDRLVELYTRHRDETRQARARANERRGAHYLRHPGDHPRYRAAREGAPAES